MFLIPHLILGHSVAATFYLVWGLWWMLASFWYDIREGDRYKKDDGDQVSLMSYLSHSKTDPLASKSWFPLPCLKRIPLEPILKMVLPGLGIFAESFLNVKHGGGGLKFARYTVEFDEKCAEYVVLSRLMHISLYSAFVISGIVDMLAHYTKLPQKTSPLFLCLALYIESHLFINHVHGRLLFNVTVHHMINIFVISTAIFATLRILNPRNLLFNSGLAASMILQSTHLYQAGQVIFNSKYNQFSHNNSKFIALATSWHLLGVGFFMMTVYVTMRRLFTLKTCNVHYRMLRSSNGAGRFSSRVASLEDDSFSETDSPESKSLQAPLTELKMVEESTP